MFASTFFTFFLFSGCDAKKRLCLFNHVRKQVITNIRYSYVHVFMYDVNVPSSFIPHQTGGVVTNFL